MEKTLSQQNDIRNRWKMRCILRKIRQLLPEGYVATNTRPIQKEICHKGSCGKAIYWSSWCKKDKERYLALLDGNKVKLIAEKDIKEFYNVRSIA